MGDDGVVKPIATKCNVLNRRIKVFFNDLSRRGLPMTFLLRGRVWSRSTMVHFDADPWNAYDHETSSAIFFAVLSPKAFLEALPNEGPNISIVAGLCRHPSVRRAEFFK